MQTDYYVYSPNISIKVKTEILSMKYKQKSLHIPVQYKLNKLYKLEKYNFIICLPHSNPLRYKINSQKSQ